MHWTDAEFVEARRLIRSFFGEARSWLVEDRPLSLDLLVSAMRTAGCTMDFSCEPLGHGGPDDRGFAARGGFAGSDREIYERLVEHTRLSPEGRVVVVPDAVVASNDDAPPFVCRCTTAGERLEELGVLNVGNDSLFVYESGAAIAVDHDNRLFWAKSKVAR